MNKKLLLSLLSLILYNLHTYADYTSLFNDTNKTLYIINNDAVKTVLSMGQLYNLNIGSSVQVSFTNDFSNPWKFEAFKHNAIPGEYPNTVLVPEFNALKIFDPQGNTILESDFCPTGRLSLRLSAENNTWGVPCR